MKRLLIFAVLGILLAASCGVSFAEEKAEEKPMMGKMMGEKTGQMMDMEKMKKMCGMMKKAGREIVATNDGGIVIMTGNKLIKYDKKLNLVNEVELKKDEEGMKGMMMERE